MDTKLIELMELAIDKKMTPGINIAVYINQSWQEYSLGNIVGDTDITTDSSTYYDIASLSKIITSSLVISLADKRQLSIEDKASKYLNFLSDYPDITIKNLLSHTSGLQLNKRYDKTIEYTQSQIARLIFNKENLRLTQT